MHERNGRRLASLVGGRGGVAIAILMVILLAGAFLGAAWRERGETLAKAAARVNITADALDAQARAFFGAQTVALEALAHEFTYNDLTTLPDSPRLRGLLRRMADGLRHINNILLIDRNGVIRSSAHVNPQAPVSVADRPYFLHHQQTPSLEVRVGKPVVSRLTGGTIFTVSRRLDALDGGFAGVLLISVRPQAFGDFHHALDLGPAGRLMLVHEDGTVLANQPHDDAPLGTRVDLAETLPGFRDGQARGGGTVIPANEEAARIVAYRRIPELKLVVVASVAEDHALAEWRARLADDMTFALPTILMLAAVLGTLVVRNRLIGVSEAEAVAARDALAAERQLFVGGPVVVFKWRAVAGWPVDYVSPNLAQQWGYEPEELRDGRTPFTALVHADDAQRVLSEADRLSKEGRRFFEQEYRIRRKDGQVRWVYDFTLVNREPDGSVACFLGYLLDITERKEMERQIEGERDFIRTVINSLPGVFYVLDPDGRFEMVNNTMARVTGYTSREILQAGPLSVLRAEDHDAITAALRRVFDTGSAEVEATLVTRDGRELPYYFTGVRFESSAGPRIVGMGLDVSPRKRMEEAIRKSNEDLESFAYIASHDLQEPLRTVSTFLQLLKREYGGALPEEGVEYINFAVDGAMRMSHLIRDLLQYSRAGRARVSTDARCDLSAAFDAAVALLGSAIADSGAEVAAGPLPVVRGDLDQLTRLLQNLIGNALKYRHKDRRPEIRVTAEESGGWVTVSVADNGIGIDPDYHDRIFQVFQRLHGRSEYEGTGIGLAICDKIATAHGGRIGVDSVPGEGATFHFTVPAV